MKVTYIGSDDPTENEVTVAFGQVFPKNKAVTVTGEATKLATNPTFKVVHEAKERSDETKPPKKDKDEKSEPAKPVEPKPAEKQAA